MSAPCRVCGRPLDDCGTCVCGKAALALRPEVEDVALFLGGAPAPLKCTACGREYVFTRGVTSIEHCYFCFRSRGAS